MNFTLTLDIAHPPMSSAEAEALLDETLRRMRLSGPERILKIIHGYGSKGEGGTLNLTVKNWVFRNRIKIRGVIEGRDLSPFHPFAQEMANELEISITKELGPANDGVTVVWVK